MALSTTLLSLVVAGGLGLFAVALARSPAASLRGRRALLALLSVSTLLVLRSALIGLELWQAGAVELPLVLVTFLAIPFLVAALAEDATQPKQTRGHWRTGVALALCTGLVGLWAVFARRGAAQLSAVEWQGFVGVLLSATLLAAWIGWRRTRGGERPAWLDSGLRLFAIHWSLSLASWLVGVFSLGAQPLGAVLETASLLSLLLFGAVVVLRAVQQLPALQPSSVPYAGSGLGERLRQERAESLRAYMESARPYLDPDLAAGDLADALGLTPRELSEVLNVEIGQGFFEFVNAARVQEAQRLLADPDRADATVLEILYAAGFNSKSAFHRAFRANVGMTPSQYRQRAAVPSALRAA